MRCLLDINVLVALLDRDHVHHGRAWRWLEDHGAAGWASCPLTQNGCVRVMSQAGYPNPLPTSAVAERLARATSHPAHAFWPDDVSLLDPRRVDLTKLHGPRQVTDVYLLALAMKHRGRFVTFDGSVPVTAARGATRAVLAVL